MWQKYNALQESNDLGGKLIMSKKHYYMHRISNESDTSYPLLDKGYLSLGWSSVCNTSVLEEVKKSEDAFNTFCKSNVELNGSRSRWSLWYFGNFKKGDTVVVPLANGLFSIYEIDSEAMQVKAIESEMGSFTNLKNETVIFSDGRLYTTDNRPIDIGFVCKVKPLTLARSRSSFADARLTARMKMFQTNGCIDDIADSVEKSKAAKTPINFYSEAMEVASQEILNKIHSVINTDKLERLIELYFKHIGASVTCIPAKNEPGKRNGADADVIAIFEQLKTVYYVQAKKHDGQSLTDDWAVTLR